MRATHWQQLFDPVLPGIFLAWAKRNDIEAPEALEELVRARGQQVADWKSLYDDVRARSEEERAAAAQALADKDGEIVGLVHERDALREQVAQLEVAPSEPARERPLLTRERDTALKLLIGMAVGGINLTRARSGMTSSRTSPTISMRSGFLSMTTPCANGCERQRSSYRVAA